MTSVRSRPFARIGVIAVAAGLACEDATQPEAAVIPAPKMAESQVLVEEDPPRLLHACYRPKKGDVYLIKETDVQEVCDKGDVEFSWNQKGVKGDRGDKGEKGDKGDPGSAVTPQLAGYQCLEGFAMVGISAAGELICRNEEGTSSTPLPPPPPPPFSPSPYDGRWTLATPLKADCSGIVGSLLELVMGSLTRIDVERIALDVVTLTPRIGGAAGAALSKPIEIPYVEGIELGDVSFAEPSFTVTGIPRVTGTASLVFAASFTRTTITGSVDAGFTGTYRTTIPVSTRCTLTAPAFTATKGS
jgi:hypothetical protein